MSVFGLYSWPSAWTGEVPLVSLPFLLKRAFLCHCDLECCLGGLRAAWHSPSSTVICFLSLDSWGIVTSLLKLNYLIRTHHGVENSEFIFFFFFPETLCTVDSVLPAFQTAPFYIIQYFFHSTLFPFHFLISLCEGH